MAPSGSDRANDGFTAMTRSSDAGLPDAVQPRRSLIQNTAWQWSIVLTFPTLFWTLAWLSPLTDKSARLIIILGEAVLLSLLGLSLILAIRTRVHRPWSVLRFVGTHPQLWIGAIYLVLSASDLRIIPMCDSGLYFKSILDAASRFNFRIGESLSAMKLIAHPAQAYAAFMMLGQFITPANAIVANVEGRMLAVAGLLGFSGIVDHLFPGDTRGYERLLAVSLLAFTPLVFGLSLTVSPDFAVLAFLSLTIFFYMRGYLVLAVASGVMLCFSKEVGALLYTSFVGGLAVTSFTRWSDMNLRGQSRAFLRAAARCSYLLLPVFLFALYLFRDGQLWFFASPQELAQAAVSSRSFEYSITSPNQIMDETYQVFIANFNWLVWGLVVVGLLAALLRRREASLPTDSSGRNRWFQVICITLVPFLMVNYRFVVWNNARYIVPMSLVAIILLMRALEAITARALLRNILLMALLALFLVSCFRTIDPVLLRVFPTFQLGKHTMSFYNSERKLCDATLYNREYVYYGRLFDRFIRESGFDPTKDEFVFFSSDKLTTWDILNLWTGDDSNSRLYVEPGTGARTFDPTGHPLLQYSLISTAGATNPSDLPAHAYSVKLFWSKKLEASTDALIRGYYKVVREIHVNEQGYYLDGYELVRRAN